MGKVLKANGTIADAWIKRDLGSDLTDLWATYKILFLDSTALDALEANTPFLAMLLTPDLGSLDDVLINSAWVTNAGIGGTPIAAAWQLVEWHIGTGGHVDELYVDGTLVSSGDLGYDFPSRFLQLGVWSPSGPDEIVYFDDVTVGAARGGSEISADNFESGSLASWTTSGDVSIVDDPLAPPPPASLPFLGKYLVDFVDKDTLAISETVYPENLEFVLHDGREPHTISFDLTFSAKNTDGDPAVPRPVGPDFVPFIGPYRSGWILRYVSENYGIDWAIASGVITSTRSRAGDDFVTIAGKSWLHILEKTQMPFNPQSPNDFRFSGTSGVTNFDPPFDVMYQTANHDIADIVFDIMSAVFTGVAPQQYRDNINYNYVLTGKLLNYRIALATTQNLLQMLLEFADTYPGFDIEMDDASRTFSIVAPFGGVGTDTLATDDTSTSYKFDSDHEGVELQFANNGPDWTHLLGVGNGLNTQYGRALGDADNQISFGRLDDNIDLGDVRDQDRVNDMTRKEFVIGLNPVHEIELVVDVEVLQDNDLVSFAGELGGFWSLIKPNKAIWIHSDLWYHILNSAQKVIAMACKVSNEGDCEVTFSLNQIYDTTVHAGDVQG